MDFLREICDRLLIENPSAYQEYLTTSRKKDDKNLYEKYTINNVNLDEVYKILNDHASIYNKKFDFYIIVCDVLIEFDNNFTIFIEINYIYNTDIDNLYKNLLYEIDFYIDRGYKISNTNQMTIKTINDRCNMSYKHYMSQPMPMCERRINMNIAKNPELFNKKTEIKIILWSEKILVYHLIANKWI